MLRITVHDNPQIFTFQIEGRLGGPWVQELEECWRATRDSRCQPVFRIDLTDVTSIDAAGRACLAELHRQGAELVADDCLTKDLVAEIIQSAESERKEKTECIPPE